MYGQLNTMKKMSQEEKIKLVLNNSTDIIFYVHIILL